MVLNLGTNDRGTQEELGTPGGLPSEDGFWGSGATNRGCGCGVAAIHQKEAAPPTPTSPPSSGSTGVFTTLVDLHLFAPFGLLSMIQICIYL